MAKKKKGAHSNLHNTMQYNGLKEKVENDKQWSTKHYTENKKWRNKNHIKNREVNLGASER